jgi:hypothetical protein
MNSNQKVRNLVCLSIRGIASIGVLDGRSHKLGVRPSNVGWQKRFGEREPVGPTVAIVRLKADPFLSSQIS